MSRTSTTLTNRGKISASEPYFDLGTHGRKVGTASKDAQVWFDRGLIWSYSFNHEEAVACFEQCIQHDPNCAMGHWGIAWAAGPNYNKTWARFDGRDKGLALGKCYKASREAHRLATSVTPAERALCSAIRARFPVDDAQQNDFAASEQQYAEAMRDVYRQFGDDDLDVVALTADAIMNSAPRKMFHAQTGHPIPDSPVFEVKQLLERAIWEKNGTNHPGLPHLYVHLMEMSATPENALSAAEVLRTLTPEAGHMHHMPTHLDVLVGDYRRSMECNLRATIADDKFFARAGGVNFYSYYRLHNYHSLIYAAMLAGQSKVALSAAQRMEATISEELLRVDVPPLADWMEFFLAVRIHIYIRFGMWKEIKDLEIPQDQDLYCVTTAMFLYGKGIAYAATGDLVQAEQIRESAFAQLRDAYLLRALTTRTASWTF